MSMVDYTEVLSSFKGEAGDVIPILQKVQSEEGYLSLESLRHISRFLKISENELFGIASFYAQFRFTKPGRHSIKVCLGTACHVQGGQVICESLERDLGILAGQTTPDGRFDMQRVACLGCCSLAPVIQIDKEIHSKVASIELEETLKKYE
jgi:NADH-quinone oxidoreductase subunit E